MRVPGGAQVSGKPRNPDETVAEKLERHRRYKREGMVRYRLRHPERVRATINASRAKKPEKYRALNREWALRSRYGIDQAAFDRMLTEQGGLCAICLHAFVGRVHVDHDHATGRVRGLLCSGCNTGLARIENIEWRSAAERYLA